MRYWFWIFLIAICCFHFEAQGQTLAGFPDSEAMRRALGLSLGAARVYEKEKGFSYAGYGEMIFHTYSKTAHWHATNLHPENTDLPTGKDSEMSLVRGVLFLGYRFNEKLVLNSEMRIDHDLLERGVATFPEFYDTQDVDTEFSLDLAYIDYIKSPALTFRGGIILLPMGLVNEFHQPSEYIGLRPGFGDLVTIPTNWHALGAGVAGRKWDFNYRAYVVSGLNAAKFTETGPRAGREISWDTIGRPGFVFRIDYNPIPNAVLGGSYYAGKSGAFGLEPPVNEKFHTTVKEAHGEFRWNGFLTRAQYAKLLLHESTELNRILGTTGFNGVSARMVGGYLEGGYNFFWHRKNGTMLMPYARGEASNPEDAIPPSSLALGLVKSWYVDFIIWVAGVEWRPVREVSIKGEYQSIHDQNQIFWREIHIGASYAF